MKEFELRFSLDGDATLVVEAKNFKDAVNKVKKMSVDELLDELIDNGSVKELVASDFDLEDTLSDKSSYRVKVYNIKDFDGKRIPKSYTLKIEASNYHGEVTDDDIMDAITDELSENYAIESDDFDFDVLEEL